MNEQKLRMAFQYFNKSGTGTITLEEVKEVMASGGCNEDEKGDNVGLDDQVYMDIMAEVHQDAYDGIDFEKFYNMMCNLGN